MGKPNFAIKKQTMRNANSIQNNNPKSGVSMMADWLTAYDIVKSKVSVKKGVL